MRISKHTDYALRTLMFLGLQAEDERSSIREISDVFDISHNHLMKVVQKLSSAGYVDGQRGKGGGVRLAMSAEQINIGLIVRDFEPNTTPVDCANGPCRFEGSCLLEQAIENATRAFFDSLERTTLADILCNKSNLIEALLHIDRLDPPPLPAPSLTRQ